MAIQFNIEGPEGKRKREFADQVQAMQMEGIQLDLAEKRRKQEMESPSGRSTTAAEIAATLEQDKQRQFGTPIQEGMAQRMTSAGGPSILDATRMQAELDVSAKAGEAKRAALMNFAAGGKSLLPTADVGMGGVKQTVLASEVGRTSADILKQIFTNDTPLIAQGYMARGYERDTAIKMAAEDVQNMLVKERSSGKVTLMSADGFTSRAIPDKEAMIMWRDPKTPKAIREQLNSIYGQSEEPQAASWIKTRLGR